MMVGDGEIALRRLKKKRILERTVRMYELLEEEFAKFVADSQVSGE